MSRMDAAVSREARFAVASQSSADAAEEAGRLRPVRFSSPAEKTSVVGTAPEVLAVFAIDLRLDHAEYILGVVGVVIRGGGHAGGSTVRSEERGE